MFFYSVFFNLHRKSSDGPNEEMYKCTNVQMYKCTNVQINVQMYKTSTFQDTGTFLFFPPFPPILKVISHRIATTILHPTGCWHTQIIYRMNDLC